MNEVEKLYENAGVEKRAYYNGCPKGQYLSNNLTCYECEYFSVENPYLKCSYRVYPPFTAEKQLELIKWLAGFWVHINDVGGQINISTGGGYISYYAGNLADAIALCINSKWNNLTDQERTEIAEILNRSRSTSFAI